MALARDDAPEQYGGLAGEQEPDEGRGLQCREREDHQQGEPRRQQEEVLHDLRHQVLSGGCGTGLEGEARDARMNRR